MGEAYEGGCHCGALRFVFTTSTPLAPRACQCGFCRRHGARSVSDPAGTAEIRLAVEPIRYRFASGATDYLICPRCGTYVGAVTDAGGRLLTTLNLNTFDDPHPDLAADPVAYEGEGAAAKAARRAARWTPVRLLPPSAAALPPENQPPGVAIPGTGAG